MNRRAYVIRHVAFEDLGLWKGQLALDGFAVRYFQAGCDDLSACGRDAPELLIVLGGPIGVYETDQYPFIADELSLIQSRIEKSLPVLGICLGAQLMAAAMGARVYPSGIKEIGWGRIRLTASGEASCLRHLSGSDHTVLHWHGDTFDLPQGATLLASTAAVRNQAFALGKSALALQFHLEPDPTTFERWLIGHTCELGLARIKPSELRASTAKLPHDWRVNSQRVLADWLAAIG